MAPGVTVGTDVVLDYIIAASIPEPGTYLTIGAALIGLCFVRRRTKKANERRIFSSAFPGSLNDSFTEVENFSKLIIPHSLPFFRAISHPLRDRLRSYDRSEGTGMTERIHKLQPNRTMALRGFDDLGAAAALHSATGDAFKVSGIFRDPADFAVLILYDADNFYEHPRLKYLPDFRFDGLTLSFDVRYSGLMPLDSPKYATIDWPYLDYILGDGTTGRAALSNTPHRTAENT